MLNFLRICIYCHPQTDCFVLSELFIVARDAGRSKPGSKPVQLYVKLSFRPVGHQADHVGLRNFKVFILATATAAFVYNFYTLSAIRVLSSYEELCITLYIYIYIYIHVCIYLYICTHARTQKHTYTRVYIYINIYMYI